MPEAAMITPADVRRFAGFPGDVPDSLLEEHLGIARRDLAKAVGVSAAPPETEAEWREALIVRALASALPWLNTFALEGAAKVGRLEGSLEYRFLNPDEVEARVKELNGRFTSLTGTIRASLPSGDAAHTETGGITLVAI